MTCCNCQPPQAQGYGYRTSVPVQSMGNPYQRKVNNPFAEDTCVKKDQKIESLVKAILIGAEGDQPFRCYRQPGFYSPTKTPFGYDHLVTAQTIHDEVVEQWRSFFQRQGAQTGDVGARLDQALWAMESRDFPKEWKAMSNKNPTDFSLSDKLNRRKIYLVEAHLKRRLLPAQTALACDEAKVYTFFSGTLEVVATLQQLLVAEGREEVIGEASITRLTDTTSRKQWNFLRMRAIKKLKESGIDLSESAIKRWVDFRESFYFVDRQQQKIASCLPLTVTCEGIVYRPLVPDADKTELMALVRTLEAFVALQSPRFNSSSLAGRSLVDRKVKTSKGRRHRLLAPLPSSKRAATSSLKPRLDLSSQSEGSCSSDKESAAQLECSSFPKFPCSSDFEEEVPAFTVSAPNLPVEKWASPVGAKRLPGRAVRKGTFKPLPSRANKISPIGEEACAS